MRYSNPKAIFERMGPFQTFHPEESRELHEFKAKISNIYSGSFVVMSENRRMNVLPHPEIH
jgi:hypothetical protein